MNASCSGPLPTHDGPESMMKSPILLYLSPFIPVLTEVNHDAARHRVREFKAIGRRRPHHDLLQQILDVGTLNSFRQILLGHDLAVQNGRRHHTPQTVTGLFFCAYDGLVAAADDVMGHVEDLNVDSLHVMPGDMVLGFELLGAFDGRLRLDFRVVFFYDGASHSLEALFGPVDVEMAHDRIHKTFVSFEDFER